MFLLADSLVIERTATKSMLASKNTRPAVNTPAQGMHWIGVLGGELNVRLRDAREINPGLWPKTLVLGTRTGMFSPLYPFPLPILIIRKGKAEWQELKPVGLDRLHFHSLAISRQSILSSTQRSYGMKSVNQCAMGAI